MSIMPDVTPTWVYPLEEQFNVIMTQSENMKRQYDLLSATPNRQFRLTWSGVTDGDFAALLKHYRDVSGEYAIFTWDCVPSYIDGGGGLGISMTGRYVGKPKWNPKARSWDLEMVFEQNI